jgi:hypothetical protein
MVYLVTPRYGHYKEGPMYDFDVNRDAVAVHDVHLRWAAAERTGDTSYRTVANSRIVGLSALAPTPGEARAKVKAALAAGFGDTPLQHRSDVADERYIARLATYL